MSVKTQLGLCFCCLLIIPWLLFWTTEGFAYEINDKLIVGGVLAGIYQYQSLSDAPGYENLGRGILSFQPEISFTPTENDELFAKLGFAAGNGLMGEGESPFTLVSWMGDVEDDVKNINGRNRDYLLTAWYKHTFSFSKGHTLGLTGGIIDATDYLDENAFANDQYNQFTNQALVNGPHAFLPSYDIGGAVEWQIDGFSMKGVAMAVGSNGEEGANEEPYNFFGVQFGYNVNSRLGAGNYRLLLDTTSSDFSDPGGKGKERKNAVLISCDQWFGEIIGAWVRFGWQDDAAAVQGDLFRWPEYQRNSLKPWKR